MRAAPAVSTCGWSDGSSHSGSGFGGVGRALGSGRVQPGNDPERSVKGS